MTGVQTCALPISGDCLELSDLERIALVDADALPGALEEARRAGDVMTVAFDELIFSGADGIRRAEALKRDKPMFVVNRAGIEAWRDGLASDRKARERFLRRQLR